MFFDKLFNWLRYKSSFVSITAKNRFFIERDVKFKNIYSMFGLVFRNSKWSSYSTPNITTNFFNFYLLPLFALLSFYLLFIFAHHYALYSTSIDANYIVFFFWSGLDTLDYYFAVSFWMLNIICTIFIKNLFSIFFNYNFNKTADNSLMFYKLYNNVSIPNLNKTLSDVKFEKSDLLWYTYLSQINQKENNPYVLEIAFNNIVNNKYQNLLIFYKYLYKNVFHILSVSNTSNINKYQGLINPLLLINKDFISIKLFMSLKRSFLELSINNFQPNKYSLRNILNKNIVLQNNTIFIKNLTYLKLDNIYWNNVTLAPLTYNIDLIFKLLKTDKWLYKYSILSPSSIKNNFYITQAMKNINTVVSPDSINNLWNIQTKTTKNGKLSTLYNNNSFVDFNYFTTSYLYNIKRFYFFNNLQANTKELSVNYINNFSKISYKTKHYSYNSFYFNNFFLPYKTISYSMQPGTFTNDYIPLVDKVAFFEPFMINHFINLLNPVSLGLNSYVGEFSWYASFKKNTCTNNLLFYNYCNANNNYKQDLLTYYTI